MRTVALRRTGRGRPQGQRGITLLIALIFLLIFGVMAVTALNTSLTSGQAIGNMQWRSEAVAAANDAIDQILSSTDFATKTDALTSQVNASPYKLDADGDGADDLRVNFPEVKVNGTTKPGPRCVRYRTVPLNSLDPNLPADRGCYSSSSSEESGLGIAGAGGTTPLGGGQSLCANTEWSITVQAEDEITSTSVQVTQGAGVRVFRSDAINQCDE